jgi:predicted lactoylglutathione lyase
MQMIFVNLPVSDVKRARHFYTALGFTINEQFSNEQAACVVVSESIYVMVLVKDFFATFTDKPISDAHKQTEVLLCLSTTSKEATDALVAKALAAGGKAPRPAKDHGFMYQHGFEDPDGHIWELAFMQGQPPAN